MIIIILPLAKNTGVRHCVTDREIGGSHSSNCDYCRVLLGRLVLRFQMYVTAFIFREELSVM